MEYIYIGKITNTHGLKGEIRILSDFQAKEKVFLPGFFLYIGKNHQKVKIISYRKHKEYDMVMLDEYNDIEQVLPFKGKKVYINREDVKMDGYFDEDYIGLEAYSNRFLGKVSDIWKSKAHDILVITKDEKQYLVPKIDIFIKKVDLEKNKIEINEIEGLFHED